MKCLNKIPSVAFWVIGVLCMLFPARVAGVLPFLLGGVMLALALLFDPFEKFSAHVVLLGVELIVANVQLPQEESRE